MINAAIDSEREERKTKDLTAWIYDRLLSARRKRLLSLGLRSSSRIEVGLFNVTLKKDVQMIISAASYLLYTLYI